MSVPSPTLFARYPALLLAVPTFLWAGSHVLGRAVAGEVPPAGLAVCRWLIATAVLFVLARPHLGRDRELLRGHLGTITFLALTGAGVFGTLQFLALQYTKAINVAVINSVAPAFILIASFAIFRDRIGRIQVLGIVISFLGVLVIVTRGHPETIMALAFNGGDVLVVFNMALWAIYSACLRLRPGVHPLSFMLAISIISGLANLPAAVAEHALGMPLPWTWTTAVTAIYFGIGTSVIAYLAWTRGVELVGAPRASAYLHLVPVFGVMLSWLFLGEVLAAYHVAGFVLILAGVTLAARRW
jgi:drug/metabolite transporter (DMT)-like permease